MYVCFCLVDVHVLCEPSSKFPPIYTRVKIIKNEIGCRDDTVPKTIETRRHCEEDWEHATIFCNRLPTSWFLGVAEDCCMLSILLTVPSCFNSFWHGVIPTSYFIFNDFYTCIHIPTSYFIFNDFYTCIHIPTSYFIFNDFYTCMYILFHF